MKSRVVVSAIITKGNSYLLGHKPTNIGPYPNTWHHLGGGVDLEKETCEEAIRREIWEEAGIEVENLRKIGFDEDYEPDKHGEMTHYVFLVYEAEYKSGELRSGDDIRKLQWVERSELGKLPLTRPSIKLFKEMGIL